MSDDVAKIAAGLTKAQVSGLTMLPAWGFPAGHNAWPEMFYDGDGDTDCEGEDMDLLLRAELVSAEVENDAPPPVVCFDMADARWTLRLTPLGLAVRQHLQEKSA